MEKTITPIRIRKKPLAGHLLLAGLIAAAVLGVYAGYAAWFAAADLAAPLTVRLEPRDFVLRIPASGELQSAETTTIAVPSVPVNQLRIASVVPDGRRVRKGDVLVEFDPAELQTQSAEHESSLQIASQKISRGEAAGQVERADILRDRRIAELELQKIKEFMPRDETIYSRREMIEGELDRSHSQRKIVFADARLELKGKIYSLEEAILLLEKKQADEKIAQAGKGLASLKLLAPAPGIIVHNDPGWFTESFAFMPGRVIWVGTTLFNLVNPDTMEAKCFVLEKDAGELRIGSPAVIALDPFPGQTFSGRVKTIDKLARPLDRDSPVKYFQTVISLDQTDPRRMRPGIKLKAEIRPGEIKSALVVPRSALVNRDYSHFAYVRKTSAKFEPVPVRLGQGDLVQVVVTNGLQAGQILALHPPDLHRETAAGSASKKTP